MLFAIARFESSKESGQANWSHAPAAILITGDRRGPRFLREPFLNLIRASKFQPLTVVEVVNGRTLFEDAVIDALVI